MKTTHSVSLHETKVYFKELFVKIDMLILEDKISVKTCGYEKCMRKRLGSSEKQEVT